ncbi:MAG: hypothetical protein M1816_007869 [Peltula sp. TS41687]|nr:MAG: hypothetical protein M1816_007869 [Peltula sp. TS41687]
MATDRVRQLSSARKQNLLVEFASLKYAGLQGIYMSITPGPYCSAVLRFEVSFSVAYPLRPPHITFSTEIFHPLVAPSTTHSYSTGSIDNGKGSVTDGYQLLPGGFSLQHGFPRWFAVGEHDGAAAGQNSASMLAGEAPPEDSSGAELLYGKRSEILSSTSTLSIIDVLRYVRSTFDTEEVLDSVPLAAAGNSSAWHAWQAHRRKDGVGKGSQPMGFRRVDRTGERNGVQETRSGETPARRGATAADWNWEGVWEERVRRGIMNSNADSALYRNSGGNGYDLIHFLNMEPEMQAKVEEEIMLNVRMTNSDQLLYQLWFLFLSSLSAGSPLELSSAQNSPAPSGQRSKRGDVEQEKEVIKDSAQIRLAAILNLGIIRENWRTGQQTAWRISTMSIHPNCHQSNPMYDSPSLEELSPTGSVVHTSPQPLTSATSTQKSNTIPSNHMEKPKPLRIVKSRSSRDSMVQQESVWNSPLNGHLPSGRSSTILPESIPKRRSSVAVFNRRKRKRFKESPRSHGSPTKIDTSRSSVSSSPMEELTVQKQRHVDIRSRVYLYEHAEAANNDVCTTASPLVTSTPVLFNSPGPGAKGDGTKPERARLQKRIPDRAVALVTKIIPSCPQLLTAPTSTTANHGVRRAATTHGYTSSKLHEEFFQTSYSMSKETSSTTSTCVDDRDCSQKLSRLRKGGFLRNLNKLDFITKSKSMVNIHSHGTERSFFERLSQRLSGEERLPSGSSAGCTGTPRSGSVQTDNSVLALSHMNITSTSIQSDSCAATLPGDHHEKSDVILPTEPSILAANVDVIPELEKLEVDEERSMWVAVDVSAELFRPNGDREVSIHESNDLDVVICFDPFTSTFKSTHSNSQKIAVTIASLLDRTRDRLAIVGFSPRFSSTQSQCGVLFPLEPINLTHITNLLMSVQKWQQSVTSPAICMDEAMKVSVDLLSSPAATSLGQSPRECSRRVLRHIFLLSSIMYEAPSKITNDIQVHIINPSIIPSKPGLWINNGWQLHLPPLATTTTDEGSIDEDADHIPVCLRKALVNMRTGNLPGRLLNVSIDISPGPNCEIEAILGDTRYRSLASGQTASIFVKVKTSPLERPPLLHVNTANPGGRCPSSDHLHAQLAVLLGQTAEDILHVKVQYKHTLLPKDTIMSVEKKGVVRRQIGQSAWGPHTMVGLNHERADNHALVYKRLGSFTAANWPPRKALDKLQELYGGDIQSQLDPTYPGPLIKELRQRARTMERHGLTHDDRPWKGEVASSTKDATTTDMIIRPLFYQQDPASKTEASIPSPTSQRPELTREESHTGPGEDGARKIWREMRRDSRMSTSSPGQRRRRGWSDGSLIMAAADRLPRSRSSSTTTEHYDDFIRDIADQAVRNKRSLGADTLRSFALDERPDSLEVGIAPWL